MSQATATLGLPGVTTELARYWWALVLRGVLATLFGVMAFVLPGLTLAVLVLMFGAWLVADGIFTVIHVFRADERKGQYLVYAAVSMVVGSYTLLNPGLGALALLYVIAFWSMLKGVLEISMAIRLRREIEHEWLLGVAGLLSVAFGILLVLLPVTGALAVVWIIGAYAVVFGACLIALGLKLRSRRARA